MIHDHRQPNRSPATWCQILNPIWWASDAEREKAWPIWCPSVLRGLVWFTRNPFCNFFSVIIGIAHRSRTIVVSNGVGWTYVRGWNHGYIQADESNLRLPFVSYRNDYFEMMLGWKTSGGFAAFPFRRANSKGPNHAYQEL